jgi:hypothetical protein
LPVAGGKSPVVWADATFVASKAAHDIVKSQAAV